MGQNLFQRRRKLYLQQQQLELQNIEAFSNLPAFGENMNDLYNNNKIIPHNALQLRQNCLEQRRKLLLRWRQQMMQNQQPLVKILPIRENMNEVLNNNNNNTISPNVVFQDRQQQRQHRFHHPVSAYSHSVIVKSENSQLPLEYWPSKYQSSLDVLNSQPSLIVAKNSDVQNNNIWREDTKSNKNLPLLYQIECGMTG